MIEAYSSMGTPPIVRAGGTREKADPWASGPRFEVSKEFQEAFLTTDAPVSIIEEAPELAREILLACLIEEHRARSPYHDFGGSSLDENAGLTHTRVFEAPFYDQGPFLFFLQAQPEAGLETLVTFINFASER